jgi:hypothetical protein
MSNVTLIITKGQDQKGLALRPFDRVRARHGARQPRSCSGAAEDNEGVAGCGAEGLGGGRQVAEAEGEVEECVERSPVALFYRSHNRSGYLCVIIGLITYFQFTTSL